MKTDKTLVIDAEPVETIEAPDAAEVFTIIAAAAALGAAIARAVS
ncbi:MAG: hypothetical protein ACRD4L_10785 [Pyrinomonadaceae bacterium]